MNFTKQQLLAIQKLCANYLADTASSKPLIEYCRAHGIGQDTGRTQTFSQADKAHLAAIYRQQTGQDVGENLSVQHRFTSPITREKTGTESVFAANLIFAAFHSNAQLPHREKAIDIAYAGVAASLRLEYCDAAKIRRLIVVENGDMLNYAYRWMPALPADWQQALLLYRGHGKNQQHVQTLLQDLPASVPVGVYPDFDPAGLAIAAAYLPRASAIIVPSEYQNLTANHRLNQRDVFIEQSRKTPAFVHPTLAALSRHIIDRQLALVQEKHQHLGALSALPL